MATLKCCFNKKEGKNKEMNQNLKNKKVNNQKSIQHLIKQKTS